MVIPGYITNIREKEFISKLKKAYLTIETAYNQVNFENGEHWYSLRDLGVKSKEEANKKFLERLSSSMSIARDCINSGNCFYTGKYKGIDGKGKDYINGIPSIQLTNGSTIGVSYQNTGPQNEEVWIIVDVNGPSNPNQYGVDLFHFFLVWRPLKSMLYHRNKIQPYWRKGGDGKSMSSSCVRTNHNTTQCAGWVLTYENMDYMHCDNLEWDVKTKCKK